MDEATIAREARLVALETMWAHTYVMVCRLAHLDDATVEKLERELLELAATRPVANLSPEWSDLFSAEIHSAIERLLQTAKDSR